jgi:hypothetical protein
MKLALELVPMSLPQKEAAQINMLEQINPLVAYHRGSGPSPCEARAGRGLGRGVP